MAAQIARCGNIRDHFFPIDGFSGTRSRFLGCRACAVSFQSYNYLGVSSRIGSGLGSKRMELLFKLKTYPAAKGDRRIRVSAKAPSIGQDNFEELVLKSDVPVLVDFWADWCGPCKLVAPIIDWVAENYAGQLKVYKIETDPNPQLVDKYKPRGLPTLILFKDGAEVPESRREGAITKAKLKALLDELLSTIAAR